MSSPATYITSIQNFGFSNLINKIETWSTEDDKESLPKPYSLMDMTQKSVFVNDAKRGFHAIGAHTKYELKAIAQAIVYAVASPLFILRELYLATRKHYPIFYHLKQVAKVPLVLIFDKILAPTFRITNNIVNAISRGRADAL